MKLNFYSVIIKLIIVYYIALCTIHYFNQRPMWNDEQAVFASIESFTAAEVFSKPLVALQVFPRVYFFLIQKTSQIFDYHLLSLRLWPFVCMIAAFFVWLKIARRELKDNVSYSIFILCWCASAALIYYSAELKQYSMDVLAASLFILFLIHQQRLMEEKSTNFVVYLVLLPALCLFSYPAFILSGVVMYNLFLMAIRNRECLRYVFIYATSLISIFCLSCFIDMRLRPVGVLNTEWGDYFISLASIGEFFKTFGEGTNNLFSRWFVERPRILKKFAIFFMVFGLLNMFYAFLKNIKKDRFLITSLNTMGFFLFLELFLMGVIKKYPFTVPRTSLFFAPIAIYFTVKAIEELGHWNKYITYLLRIGFVAFLIFINIGLAQHILEGDLGAMPLIWESIF